MLRYQNCSFVFETNVSVRLGLEMSTKESIP